MDPVETTCGTLLRELQHIWDEVGESDEERDRMLLQLEQECLEVYRRKVDQANHGRARLHRALADAESELASLLSMLGEIPMVVENRQGSLKEQFAAIYPHLEEMRRRKEERVHQLADVKLQIRKIRSEIAEAPLSESASPGGQQDLSLRKLEELQVELQMLQKEKSDRLNQVLERMNAIYNLCSVLSVDFHATVADVHPSLKDADCTQCKSISNETLDKLAGKIRQLQDEKKDRMVKLQDLGTSLIELWNLMDSPSEEQQSFQHVTCHLAATADEINTPGALSFEIMEKAGAEVERLSQLKISKMKELVLKKRDELEEICNRAHMECDSSVSKENITELIDSGVVDPSDILFNMEEQIGKAKEEAFDRKEILERIERWMAACEEECWLEDYNKDENRYSASRGAHLNLKRAERARATVNKLPALVDLLAAKARAWEEERGVPFLYNGVSLVSMLDEYNLLRQEKEEQKRRMRDHKKIQEQLITEQEVMFGSRPSPNKQSSIKKSAGASRIGNTTANRRLSLGGPDLLTPRVNGVTPSRLASKENKRIRPMDTPGSHFPDRKPLTPVPVVPVAKNNFEPIKYTETTPVKPTLMRKNSIVQAEEEDSSAAASLTPVQEQETPETPVFTTPVQEQVTTPGFIPPVQEQIRETPVFISSATSSSVREIPVFIPEKLLAATAAAATTAAPRDDMEYSFEERRLHLFVAATS